MASKAKPSAKKSVPTTKTKHAAKRAKASAKKTAKAPPGKATTARAKKTTKTPASKSPKTRTQRTRAQKPRARKAALKVSQTVSPKGSQTTSKTERTTPSPRAKSRQATKQPQIFVSIASYRDQFLHFTIESVLKQATYPERLTFGLCWQADDTEQLDQYLHDPRFRIRKYPYYASLGYGWARAEIQKLYAGEEYHLLIDSHTYLAKGWDENLIAQLESKPGEKPLLTTSSPPFTFDNDGNVVIPWQGTEHDGVPLMKCARIQPAGWVDIQMSNERKSTKHQTTGLVCCNFVFTHGAWIREVPEDPAMINAGHESALSVRTFTHGYDIYLPDEIQIWHLDYNNYPNGERNKVWEAKSDSWQSEGTEIMLRRLQALFYNRGDRASLGRYGLGRSRTVADWAEITGLDLSD